MACNTFMYHVFTATGKTWKLWKTLSILLFLKHFTVSYNRFPDV